MGTQHFVGCRQAPPKVLPSLTSRVSQDDQRLLVASGEMSTRLVKLMVRTARCDRAARLDEHAFALKKSFFGWLAKHNFILFKPASELELPRLGHRLPKAILSAAESDKVIDHPNVNDASGFRDRARCFN